MLPTISMRDGSDHWVLLGTRVVAVVMVLTRVPCRVLVVAVLVVAKVRRRNLGVCHEQPRVVLRRSMDWEAGRNK